MIFYRDRHWAVESVVGMITVFVYTLISVVRPRPINRDKPVEVAELLLRL